MALWSSLSVEVVKVLIDCYSKVFFPVFLRYPWCNGCNYNLNGFDAENRAYHVVSKKGACDGIRVD